MWCGERFNYVWKSSLFHTYICGAGGYQGYGLCTSSALHSFLSSRTPQPVTCIDEKKWLVWDQASAWNWVMAWSFKLKCLTDVTGAFLVGILGRKYCPPPAPQLCCVYSICRAGCVIILGGVSQRLLLEVPAAEFYIDMIFVGSQTVPAQMVI